MRALFNGYQTSKVNTSYEPEDVQICYLLRYFAPYSQLLQQVLTPIGGWSLGTLPTLTVSLLGTGPAPELCGLLKWLGTPARTPLPSVHAHLFDSGDWTFARAVSLGRVLPAVWSEELSIQSHHLDVSCSWNDQPDLEAVLSSSNLIVLQNCLNEIDTTAHTQILQNLRWLSTTMIKDALLVVIDRTRYEPVLEFIRNVKLLENEGHLACARYEENAYYDAGALHNDMPAVLLNSTLLYRQTAFENPIPAEKSGLVVRRNLDYHAVAMRKV